MGFEMEWETPPQGTNPLAMAVRYGEIVRALQSRPGQWAKVAVLASLAECNGPRRTLKKRGCEVIVRQVVVAEGGGPVGIGGQTYKIWNVYARINNSVKVEG